MTNETMSCEAIFLYGSKARGDDDRFSDTDLLGVSLDGPIMKAFDSIGVSLHVYPLDWLRDQAADGSLFLLHLVTEARPLFDPRLILEEIRSSFLFKKSYFKEVEIGCRIVASSLAVMPLDFTEQLRKRYFWGLRTALMALSAEEREPKFSSRLLEDRFSIAGLMLHIQSRNDATVSECQRFGRKVIELMGHGVLLGDGYNQEENLRYIMSLGGAPGSIAAEMLYEG